MHYTEFGDIPRKEKENPSLWIWDPKNPPHLNKEAIERFDDNPKKLSDDERHRIEVHLGDCEACRQAQKKPLLF